MLTIKQVYGKEKAVDKLVKIRYISNYSELFSKYQKMSVILNLYYCRGPY